MDHEGNGPLVGLAGAGEDFADKKFPGKDSGLEVAGKQLADDAAVAGATLETEGAGVLASCGEEGEQF